MVKKISPIFTRVHLIYYFSLHQHGRIKNWPIYIYIYIYINILFRS
jgi:hypothetical protein